MIHITVKKFDTLAFTCQAKKHKKELIVLPVFYNALSEQQQAEKAAATYAANQNITNYGLTQ